ncbi:hypothetical protein [Hominifimenecus sp. rT4P-3]|uniref:hypothetical protein n=1 Tax=Hominifimenecus sp. rT4P-3 TaxID=3242979 RepID=UPI003DA336F5
MKKVGMLVLALLACSMMMVACSSDKETTAAETTAAETTAAETTAAETTAAETTAAETTAAETTAAEAGASTEAGDGAQYLAWTKAEWGKASDEEKTAAANAVLMDIGEAIMPNFSEMMEEAKTDAGVKAQLDGQVETLVGQIDTFFTSVDDTTTLQALVDASKQVVNSSSTTAAQ